MTYQQARSNMIKQQLRTGDVLSERILALFETFPREDFVPPTMQQFAYSDMQIPLAHQQRMLTPLEEGKILQALNLQGNETILEVGTGTGYLTALLSQMAKFVISVDYFAEFTKTAQLNLAAHHCHNVELVTGDACRGWFDKAPYHAVILTGAVEILTESHRLQVLPGGQLVAIVGKAPVMKCLLYKLDHHGVWTQEILFETAMPALIDKLKPKEFVF